MGNEASRVQWGKVTFGAGVAMMAVAGLLAAVRNAPRTAATAAPPSVRVVPAALTPATPSRPAIEDATCDAHGAPDAMLRERGTGAAVIGRAFRLQEILNGLPNGTIRTLGWAAEESDTGPPCYATFAYEIYGVRHTARFKFWPRPPARLATANDDAAQLADLVEAAGVGGVAVTQVQSTVATLLRLAGGFYNEDVYMSPRVEGELIVRRQHCVAENIDLSVPNSRQLVRTLRHAHITRYRCAADNEWITDVPSHGRVEPPHLAEPAGEVPPSS